MNSSIVERDAGIDSTLQPVRDGLGSAFVPDTPLAGSLFARSTRMGPRPASTTGWIHDTMVRPGFSLFLADLQFAESSEHSFQSGDHLKLHFKLNGNSVISGEDGDNCEVSAGQMSFLVQPAHSIKYERVKANTHERSITMICSRDFASALLPAASGDIPGAILDFLNACTSRFTHDYAPLPPQMRPIVEELLSPRAGMLGGLMLEAKALELLYLALSRVLDATPAEGLVRPRDRRKVQELCEILQAQEGSALNIGQLCKLLAWNETQMMESFKQVTGTTISTFRQRVRMDQALRQLRTSDASITEVAFDAGYEHPSNFATAFKRTFGFSPKAARARLS